jgi:RNA polymerase sigma factor (sigma-70 family)
MRELNDDLWLRCRNIAEKTIHQYARGLLEVDELTRRIISEWNSVQRGGDQPPQRTLVRIAQRNCSRQLWSAWRSDDVELHNLAFENLRRYLNTSLSRMQVARSLQPAHAAEDVLHQTLEILHQKSRQGKESGPGDPASFLKWTQTILVRQVYSSYRAKDQPGETLSLENSSEEFLDEHPSEADAEQDPVRYVLRRELHDEVIEAIFSLRSPRYREVLICSFLVGMTDRELARYMNIDVKDVHQLRHRALRALRRKKELMESLRSLLE